MPPRKSGPPAGADRPGSAAEAAEAPGFEQALARLETIVEELESGSLTLEASLAHYEEGVRLSRQLTQTLDRAEQRIERLVEEEPGAPATRPLELGLEPADRPAPGARAPGGQTAEDELPF